MNIEELISEIDNDIINPTITQRRYPIRFVFFYNRKDIIEFIDKIKLKEIFKIKYLSDYLKFEEQWLTIDEIHLIISDIKENIVFLGLSEFLRFCDKKDFNVLLNRLAEIETNDNFRIIIPLFGLKERFEIEFWQYFARKKASAPYWDILILEFERILIYSFNLNITEINFLEKEYILIKNTKDWLNLLKQPQNKQIISTSNTLNYFFENFLPDKNFYSINISTFEKFLSTFFNNNFEIEYITDDGKFWQILTEYIIKNEIKNYNFESLIKYIFNFSETSKIENNDIIDLYFKTEFDSEKILELSRWLLKHFVIKNSEKFKYLSYIFSNLDKFKIDSFVSLLWFKIFDIDNPSYELANERREILSYIYNNKPKIIDIDDKLQEFLDQKKGCPIEKVIQYLTNITNLEKIYVINKLCESNNLDEDLNKIKSIFPDIYYYLTWENVDKNKFCNENEWILNYFKEYNKCKILNKKSETIVKTIDQINKDKKTLCEWYYKIKEIKPIDYTKTIWVDGLGLEWLPLVIYYIRNYNKEKTIHIDFEISRAKLPSITEINKFENLYKISKLDEFIHNQNPYTFPKTIIDEFSIIKEIVSETISKIRDYGFIVSDHGFTFLSQKKFGEFKKCNFSASSHDGRCVLDKISESNDEYYCNWDIEGTDKKAIIALKYSSLEDVPYRETHGGATPEEVIVPFIKIEYKESEKINYKIKLKSDKIKIINSIIELSIDPEPQFYEEIKVIMAENNNKEYIAKKEGTFYKIELDKNISTGKKTIKVLIGKTEKEFEIEVISGLIERELI